jgi:hypothetical protein
MEFVDQLSRADRRTLALIKVGMTRREVDKLLAHNGGLIFGYSEDYFLPETRFRGPENPNTIVAIDIEFKPAAMDEATFADSERRNAWILNHKWTPWHDPDDVVRVMSKPYAGNIAID